MGLGTALPFADPFMAARASAGEPLTCERGSLCPSPREPKSLPQPLQPRPAGLPLCLEAVPAGNTDNQPRGWYRRGRPASPWQRLVSGFPGAGPVRPRGSRRQRRRRVTRPMPEARGGTEVGAARWRRRGHGGRLSPQTQRRRRAARPLLSVERLPEVRSLGPQWVPS